MDEYQQIPQELIEFFQWGEGGEFEEDVIHGWLNRPREHREELWRHIQAFVDSPPTELQLYLLACERSGDSTEAEVLEILHGICHRLELSLRAAP
jgi:hypothetical protein